jgi:hypothetical protein
VPLLSLFVLPLDRIEIAFEADFIDINSIISSISLNWFLLRKEKKARARLFSSVFSAFSPRPRSDRRAPASRANEQFDIISAFLTCHSDPRCDDRAACADQSRERTRAVAAAECHDEAPVQCLTSA